MLLYEYKVRDEFERVRDLAERIRAKFNDRPNASELIKDCELLAAAYEQLTQLLPEGLSGGNFGRHLHFMLYYLKQNAPDGAQGDIKDICKSDLPALEHAFRDWCAGYQHYDAEFSAKIGKLLVERNLDSAVRKAFVLLKKHLVRTFGLPSNLDGRDLVNQVFGKNGYLFGKIPELERESMRNLLDGLFGTFRNAYSHTDVEPEWHEVEAVLSMINWAIKLIFYSWIFKTTGKWAFLTL
jgi:hypothetical protein